jgi:hypothetical protein
MLKTERTIGSKIDPMVSSNRHRSAWVQVAFVSGCAERNNPFGVSSTGGRDAFQTGSRTLQLAAASD